MAGAPTRGSRGLALEDPLLGFADLLLQVLPGDIDAFSTGAGVRHQTLTLGIVEHVGQRGMPSRYLASAGMHRGCAPQGAT